MAKSSGAKAPKSAVKKVSVKVVAKHKGYYQNQIRNEGAKFDYEDHIEGSPLPSWMKAADAKSAAKVKAPEVEDEAEEEAEDEDAESLV